MSLPDGWLNYKPSWEEQPPIPTLDESLKKVDTDSELEKAFAEVELYVVQNQEGKFYRRKGYGGHGNSWVDDIKTARVYVNKIGPARAVVSYFATAYPEFGVPIILRLTIGQVDVVDEGNRVKKMLERKVKQEAQRLVQGNNHWRYNQAKRDYESSKKALDTLFGKEGADQ